MASAYAAVIKSIVSPMPSDLLRDSDGLTSYTVFRPFLYVCVVINCVLSRRRIQAMYRHTAWLSHVCACVCVGVGVCEVLFRHPYTFVCMFLCMRSPLPALEIMLCEVCFSLLRNFTSTASDNLARLPSTATKELGTLGCLIRTLWRYAVRCAHAPQYKNN